MICQEAVDLIKGFEGLHKVRSDGLVHPYRDPIGIWTIGYGAIYGIDGKRVKSSHRPITIAEAESLLLRDLRRFERGVRSRLSVPVTDKMFGALVSFSFNLGLGNFGASTLRRRINNLDFHDVEYQFSRWNKAGGRVLRGLVRRREAEASLFMEGLAEFKSVVLR